MSEWLIHYRDTAKQQTKQQKKVSKSTSKWCVVCFICGSRLSLSEEHIYSKVSEKQKKLNTIHESKQINKKKKIRSKISHNGKRHTTVTTWSVFPTQANKRRTITAHGATQPHQHQQRRRDPKSIFVDRKPKQVDYSSFERRMCVSVCNNIEDSARADDYYLRGRRWHQPKTNCFAAVILIIKWNQIGGAALRSDARQSVAITSAHYIAYCRSGGVAITLHSYSWRFWIETIENDCWTNERKKVIIKNPNVHRMNSSVWRQTLLVLSCFGSSQCVAWWEYNALAPNLDKNFSRFDFRAIYLFVCVSRRALDNVSATLIVF